MKRYCLILLTAIFFYGFADAQNLNTILMQSTFKIEGPSTRGMTLVGTVFFMGLPSKKDSTKAYYVMVTAAHVLDSIKGDYAFVHFRAKNKKDSYEKLLVKAQIREEGNNLYVKNKNNIDVAVMYFPIPKNVEIPLLPTTFIANDSILIQYDIQPGDQLFCLGYPFGEECNDDGFPILRSGNLASYPVTPSSVYKTFLIDLRSYGGNSGGPVYFSSTGNRMIKGNMYMGMSPQFVMGLLSEDIVYEEPSATLFESKQQRYPLSLAKVICGQYILETIKQLPNIDK